VLYRTDGGKWKKVPFSEIPRRNIFANNFSKPKWPYQAIIMIPDGLCLILQTEEADKEQQEK
jgi:hypothetical protein